MKMTINQLISKLEEAKEIIGGDKEVKLWVSAKGLDYFGFAESDLDEIDRNLGDKFVSFQIEKK